MARGKKPGGLKTGGRPPGGRNKRTLAKLEEASNRITEIKKSGQKRAIEVLNDLIVTSMGMVALYQRKVMTTTGLLPDVKPDDMALFKDFMMLSGTFAKALAPFQDPTFTAIRVSQSTPDVVKTINQDGSNVVPLPNDAVALARVYANMVKRVG